MLVFLVLYAEHNFDTQYAVSVHPDLFLGPKSSNLSCCFSVYNLWHSPGCVRPHRPLLCRALALDIHSGFSVDTPLEESNPEI